MIAENRIGLIQLQFAEIALGKTAGKHDLLILKGIAQREESINRLFLRTLYKAASVNDNDISIRRPAYSRIALFLSQREQYLAVNLVFGTAQTFNIDLFHLT